MAKNIIKTIDDAVRKSGLSYSGGSRLPDLNTLREILTINLQRQSSGTTYVYIIRNNEDNGTYNLDKYSKG